MSTTRNFAVMELHSTESGWIFLVKQPGLDCPLRQAFVSRQFNYSFVLTTFYCPFNIVTPQNCIRFVRVNDRAEMNRFIEQKRKEKEEQREIERKEKEVLKVLEGGVFDSGDNGNKNRQKELPPPKTETENTAATTTATTTISATGEVETTISATSGDLNQSNGDAVVSTANSDTVDIRTSNTDISLTAAATRTTGSSTTDEKPRRKKAKIDAETGLECVDMNENCPFLAATVRYMG